MKNYVALLRGINVSGQKKMPMAILRQQLEELGFQNVETYIQSGNVVFRSSENSISQLAAIIHNMILQEYDFDVPVLVLTATKIKETIENNPFLPEKEGNAKDLYVTFLEGVPEPSHLEKLNIVNSGRDQFMVKENVIYLHCPDGYGRTRLNNNFIENKLKLKATTRNWKTTLKLLEMVNTSGTT
ncbi:MAG: DUF1697 domain-containing protein [Owenweeksia sp.]